MLGIAKRRQLAARSEGGHHHRRTGHAVSTEVGAEHTGTRRPGRFVQRFVDDRPGPVAEEHAGVAISVVDQEVEFLDTDNENGALRARRDHRGGGHRAVDESRAGRVQIEGRRVHRPETLLQRARATRTRHLRRQSAHDDEVEVGRLEASGGQSVASGNLGHVGCLHVAEPALGDSGSVGNPVIGGLDEPLEIRVGQRERRAALAPSGDHRAGHGSTRVKRTARMRATPENATVEIPTRRVTVGWAGVSPARSGPWRSS